MIDLTKPMSTRGGQTVVNVRNKPSKKKDGSDDEYPLKGKVLRYDGDKGAYTSWTLDGRYCNAPVTTGLDLINK